MLNFSDPTVIIANIAILLFIGLGIYSGFKKGLFETGIRFLGSIIALVGAYIFKNPLSVFLYTHLPFFKLDGVLKGVSVINIVIYEIIAFLILFAILMLLIKVICKLTGVIDRILSFVFLFGLPNKILGAIVGFIESIVVLYFAIVVLNVGAGVFGFQIKDSLANKILDIPILNKTFGSSVGAIEEISSLASNYENIEDKDVYNKESLRILLKYEIIVPENVQLLQDKGKINISDLDQLLKEYEE